MSFASFTIFQFFIKLIAKILTFMRNFDWAVYFPTIYRHFFYLIRTYKKSQQLLYNILSDK